MKAFHYQRADSVDQALAMAGERPDSRYVAGGTNLIDLMKLQIEVPTTVIDLNRVGLDKIETEPDGGLRIGAMVRNSDLAADRRVRTHYAVLARALLSGASGQLRNKATTAGNLLQRTRCPYFYDTTQACNKRRAGSGCAAIGGQSRSHAVLGGSDHCIAVHPSDMCVALRSLDATVETVGPGGARRRIPIADFHSLPGSEPQRENALLDNELVTAVVLPPAVGGQHAYRKVRDRASYAFATLSCAAILVRDGDRITQARLAFGGLATKPWRIEAAERTLVEGGGANDAADAILAGAKSTEQNRFKLALLRRTLLATLDNAQTGTHR
jgi:xanthine dehydrogenase YagS FAD-binding subunit